MKTPDTPTSPVFHEAISRSATMAQVIHDDDPNQEAEAAQTPPIANTLDQLQTPQQVELLDKIDELRNQGLGHHGISLPQIVVCGEQSSGKSSLLEGLTRLRFPTKDTFCTAFATEVVLRSEASIEITCTITPAKSRTQIERNRLSKFIRTFKSREDFIFQDVVDEAKRNMQPDIKADDKSIFHDVLRIKYSGPDLPSLTIVDLPGIIARHKDGGIAVARISELVAGYMHDERSIILGIVPAQKDFDSQHIVKLLEEADPRGARTIGIVTMPDKLDRGSNREREYINLAKNEEYPLRHRWHSIRNRGFEDQTVTDAQRDAAEMKFFGSGSWSSVPAEDVGISSLRVKLARVLLEHITKELPSLVAAVQSGITTTERRLKALGDARETSRQQRSYLTGHAEKFQMLTLDALRGIYSNSFFAFSSQNEQANTRLRTEVQNLNIAFAHIMHRKGHTWRITDDHFPVPSVLLHDQGSSVIYQEYDAEFGEPTVIRRSEFLEKHIGGYVQRSRPAGLPSLVNPLVIGEVFRQQSQSWKDIAILHLKRTFEAVKGYIEEALTSLMDPRTCRLLMLKQVQPELERRWQSVEQKFEELLKPYTEQDPITYDPEFIRELEEIRAARYRAPMLNTTVVSESGQQRGPSSGRHAGRGQLLTESMDDFTNSEILDLMQTYYKRAMSVFINNIAVLAIENCLLSELSGIFSPSLIADLSDQMLRAIAAESKEVHEERSSLREKLRALQSGKQILNEHIAMRPTVRKKKITPAVSRPRRFPQDTRPRTPDPPRRADDEDSDKEVEANDIDDLANQLDNLVVTPPPSSDSKPAHRRVDSAHASPSPPRGIRRSSPWGKLSL